MIMLKFRVPFDLSEQLKLFRKEFMCSRRFTSTSATCNFEELILKNTVSSRRHLTPELKLRLITPDCELWYSKQSESCFPSDPFWGIYWPGGQALSRYVLDNKELFQGKCVLDIGSGSGASALAAAKSGAKYVLANDIDPVSISAININSRLNNLTIHTCDTNLIGTDINSYVKCTDKSSLKLNWNIILVGDMFYDSDFSKNLFIWLSNLVGKNKLVLIGDPGRHALKELDGLRDIGTLLKIAEYSLCDMEHNGISSSSVFKGFRVLEERPRAGDSRREHKPSTDPKPQVKVQHLLLVGECGDIDTLLIGRTFFGGIFLRVRRALPWDLRF